MIDNSTLEKLLTENLGKTIIINNISHVSGGSINTALKVSTNTGNYFIKTNSATRFPRMFEKEAKGLSILQSTHEIQTPEVLAVLNNNKESFLVLNYINSTSSKENFWRVFGQKMANLHKHTNNEFGLDHDNYIGSLIQTNNYKST